MPFRFNPFTDKLDLIDTGGANNSGLVLITGPDVDITKLGNTTVFTPVSAFVPAFFFFVTVQLTGMGMLPPAICNIGWTPASYNDLSDSFNWGGNTNILNTATGSSLYVSGVQLPIPVIPAATPLIVNVTTNDTTATTNKQRFFLVGNYL